MASCFPAAIPLDCRTDEEWLAARRTFIGASESPTLLGVGYANASAASVYADKLGTGMDRPDDLRLWIGKQKEPLLRQLFERETGQPCDLPEAMAYRSKALPFAGASLDGVTRSDEHGLCPVELKNVGRHNLVEWESDAPPLKYQVQVQHQLLVTGAQAAFLMGLVADEQVFVRLIVRDEAFLTALAVRLAEFWRCVETRTLPPLDESEATARALAAIYPRDTGETIMLPPEAAEWVAQREQATEAANAAAAQKTFAENKLKAALGENTIGVLPDGRRVSWKEQSSKGYTVEPKSYRVLRVGKAKGE